MEYTVQFISGNKISAELEIHNVTASVRELSKHYFEFGKIFMRNIKFDRINLIKR